MGAENWSCFAPYQENIEEALDALKEREMERLRTDGFDELREMYGWTDEFGNEPETLEELLERASEGDGFKSILDMVGVSETPEFLYVSPLKPKYLEYLFGTRHPTHEMVENCHEIWADFDRGYGVYVIVYQRGFPSEIFFAGYSVD